MNKFKLSERVTEYDLAAAIDQTVETAVALGIQESELIRRITIRMHAKKLADFVSLRAGRLKKTYNPDAGP